jgi:lipopolysaccharide transport protein LptA
MGIKISVFLVVVAIACVLLRPLVARTEESRKNPAGGKISEKTRITADRLLVDSNGKYAEFVGDVRLIQAGTVITANTLKIFFTGGLDTVGNASAAKESIKRIIAKGDVRIQLDDGVMVAQQAEFISETNTYILLGEDSKLIRGKSSVSGSKITFTRTDGRITVEGSETKRVEAVIFQGKEGIR